MWKLMLTIAAGFMVTFQDNRKSNVEHIHVMEDFPVFSFNKKAILILGEPSHSKSDLCLAYQFWDCFIFMREEFP
jgi:hypothetical protein